MRRTLALVVAFLSSLGAQDPASRPAADPWVVYAGSGGVGQGKRIVFLTGDEEYRSEEGMPQLARILARLGFHCTVLFAIDKKKLVFVDASSQRVVAGPFTAPGATFPDPELVNANAVLVGSRLLLAHANPPGYLTIDVAAKKASAPVALPLCP